MQSVMSSLYDFMVYGWGRGKYITGMLLSFTWMFTSRWSSVLDTFMKQQFFYFKRLTGGDVYPMLMHVILSFWIFFYYSSKVLAGVNPASDGAFIPFYVFFTQGFMYMLLYSSLSNLSAYLIWMLFGLIHFGIYYMMVNDPALQMHFKGYKLFSSTVVVLLWYQFLRWISIKVQHQELVVPTKNSKKDVFGESTCTAMDALLLALYFLPLIGLMVFWI